MSQKVGAELGPVLGELVMRSRDDRDDCRGAECDEEEVEDRTVFDQDRAQPTLECRSPLGASFVQMIWD